MRIGELARYAGVDVQTVRFYEREGLLEASARTPAGYRTYGPAQLDRLNFVRHCRSLDMPLADIKRLVGLASDRSLSCDDVIALVQAHLDRIRAKRTELERLESKLTVLRAQCSSGHRVGDCGILEGLTRAAQREAGAHYPQKSGEGP